MEFSTHEVPKLHSAAEFMRLVRAASSRKTLATSASPAAPADFGPPQPAPPAATLAGGPVEQAPGAAAAANVPLAPGWPTPRVQWPIPPAAPSGGQGAAGGGAPGGKRKRESETQPYTAGGRGERSSSAIQEKLVLSSSVGREAAPSAASADTHDDAMVSDASALCLLALAKAASVQEPRPAPSHSSARTSVVSGSRQSARNRLRDAKPNPYERAYDGGYERPYESRTPDHTAVGDDGSGYGPDYGQGSDYQQTYGASQAAPSGQGSQWGSRPRSAGPSPLSGHEEGGQSAGLPRGGAAPAKKRRALRRKQEGRTSVYRNVAWHRKARKWQVQIYHNRRTAYVGQFDDEREAAMAADKRCVELGLETRNTEALIKYAPKD